MKTRSGQKDVKFRWEIWAGSIYQPKIFLKLPCFVRCVPGIVGYRDHIDKHGGTASNSLSSDQGPIVSNGLCLEEEGEDSSRIELFADPLREQPVDEGCQLVYLHPCHKVPVGIHDCGTRTVDTLDFPHKSAKI